MEFKELHYCTLKVKVSDTAELKTEQEFIKRFETWLDKPSEGYLYVSESVDLGACKKMLKALKPDTLDIPYDYVNDGCYGMSPGTTSKGFTIRIDAAELPDRWDETDEDGEYTEWFNPIATMEHAGWKLVSRDLDADDFFEHVSHRSDNTYNWSGQSESVVPLYDVSFHYSEPDDTGQQFIGAMFHYGGDPRGNYGQRYLFVVEDNEAFYEGLAPFYFGKDEEE